MIWTNPLLIPALLNFLLTYFDIFVRSPYRGVSNPSKPSSVFSPLIWSITHMDILIRRPYKRVDKHFKRLKCISLLSSEFPSHSHRHPDPSTIHPNGFSATRNHLCSSTRPAFSSLHFNYAFSLVLPLFVVFQFFINNFAVIWSVHIVLLSFCVIVPLSLPQFIALQSNLFHYFPFYTKRFLRIHDILKM